MLWGVCRQPEGASTEALTRRGMLSLEADSQTQGADFAAGRTETRTHRANSHGAEYPEDVLCNKAVCRAVAWSKLRSKADTLQPFVSA